MDFKLAIDPKPCCFDHQILPQLILQKQLGKDNNQTKSYQLVEAGREDWQTVEALYSSSKVFGYDIAKIEVIVNKIFSQGFYYMLEIFEARNQKAAFAPTWYSEAISDEEKQMRKQVYDDLCSHAKTPETFLHVKVVPMFHGTKQDILENIFSGSLAALSTTDPGFFGRGIYHSSSACYANKYAQYVQPHREGALLMNWVCFSSAYPVIHHPDIPNDDYWDILPEKDVLKKKHWKYLWGRGGAIEGKYDAHYALVTHPKYFPFKKGETHTCNELITFDSGQVLPRYLITLTPDLAHTAALAPKFLAFTTSQMKTTLQQLTTQIQTGQIAEALIYRLKTIQDEGKPLSEKQLVEFGHLLYLARSQTTPEQRQESTQFLIKRITCERVQEGDKLIPPEGLAGKVRSCVSKQLTVQMDKPLEHKFALFPSANINTLIDPPNYYMISAKNIDFQSGLYAWFVCRTCQKEEWVYQKESWVVNGEENIFRTNKIGAKIECSCGHKGSKIKKIALCEISFDLSIRIKEKYGGEPIFKPFTRQENFAVIIENFYSQTQYLKIKIK